MAKRQRKAQRQGLSLGANIAIIVVLALGAVALSYLAFQNLNDPNPQGFATRNSDTSESSTVTQPTDSVEQEEVPSTSVGEETQEAQENQSTVEQIELVAQSRLMALDGSLGVRAEVGECTDPGNIEFSTDAGQTWIPSTAFEETNATQILRILPGNGGATFIVALNEACTPQIYSTPDNGSTWNGPLSAVGTWFLDPETPSFLGAPGGAKTIACEALGISPVTDRDVGVLCSDGSVLITIDGGTTWSDPVSVNGIAALAYSKQNLLGVANGDEICSGLKLVKLGTDTGVEEISCVEIDPGTVTAGEVALAESNSSLILWAGENQYISMNGGQTWL
ncbi:hypothetical protein [Corynebacterium efficiens]|uniref:Sialidase domain-containing protein n=1 Tax=Corynebacterium efficiens (strain DSM 44549 / YS-314 / AJ 12310 / JCM 11189 / NBRC 100395) TaxID=196164 RepID=Q8FSM4_COREF|nr:hypothetical protein [Corynebacterium efficiens]BAC17169.1 hypothetical protein [Corynebacterium efficiens YS-314]